MNSKINYVLLVKDLAATQKSIKELADLTDVDISVLGKLTHQAPGMRGISLEHFAKIVDGLGKSADRYIIRTNAIGGVAEDRTDEDDRANTVSTVGYLDGLVTWYQDRDNALAEWEGSHPRPDHDSE